MAMFFSGQKYPAGVKTRIEWDAVLIYGVMTMVIIYIVLFGLARVLTENRCLKAGYPNAAVSWKLDRYCIKRVDQTDQVVPLRVAENLK